MCQNNRDLIYNPDYTDDKHPEIQDNNCNLKPHLKCTRNDCKPRNHFGLPANNTLSYNLDYIDDCITNIYRLVERSFWLIYFIAKSKLFLDNNVVVGQVGGIYYKLNIASSSSFYELHERELANIIFYMTNKFKIYNPYEEEYFVMLSKQQVIYATLLFGPTKSIWAASLEGVRYIGNHEI
ncbi:hypothetical protein TPHA_0K00110 [Tetrapisispora phaffii CBS 4417]|uniref:Uncharacterized protein n=1 Tax=Tetrapisispora phaffii (strain ATCC 24235 / CBS 4417 / NBRC 1672 / NRRL Y-8282 / UCD 70-5) TaxID=1071381 RepID=G8BZ17_TETPH|nr:hypothetical protein TPHA_0K00110 [Tetrapisispora phaffii CBS 4417]CCE65145.1 hypothetical protein TPHA_0K00110 [Tetrapisispora phaffii CBS 4417]